MYDDRTKHITTVIIQKETRPHHILTHCSSVIAGPPSTPLRTAVNPPTLYCGGRHDMGDRHLVLLWIIVVAVEGDWLVMYPFEVQHRNQK